MSIPGRFQPRKQSSFAPRAPELSSQQQAILAAVPHWKQVWVRPASLKPGQRPNFKILKWVVDTSVVEQAGTAEETAAALEVVQDLSSIPSFGTEANTEASTPLPVSGTATPAIAMEQDGAAVVPNASKPAEGPAPDLSLPTVEDAVKDVPAVESTAAPLVEGGDTPMIVEDEVQVAEEAQAGMPVDV